MIPRSILVFLLKALILFIAWKGLYLSVLKPKRTLDGPLTHFVGFTTGKALNLFSGPVQYTTRDVIDTVRGAAGALYFPSVYIYRNGQRTLSIGDPCNALEVMVLYAGFLFCFPSPLRRRGYFLAAGLFLICLINIIRCMLLVLIAVHYQRYLDVSHHIVFTIVVYSFIFVMWYMYTKTPAVPKGAVGGRGR